LLEKNCLSINRPSLECIDRTGIRVGDVGLAANGVLVASGRVCCSLLGVAIGVLYDDVEPADIFCKTII
jgi:hypothetical protein